MFAVRPFVTSSIAVAACLLAAVTQAFAATHFDVTVSGPASPVYHPVVSFQTPSGTVTNEVTLVRVVVTTPTDAAGLFRIQPPPGTGRTTADVTVGGGPVPITEDVGAVTVASVIAQHPSTAPTVAAGFDMVEIFVAYQSGYPFDPAGETWSLQALQVATDHRYVGFAGEPCVPDPLNPTNCADEVTLPRLGLSPTTLAFGDTQINLPTDATPITPYTIENRGTATLTMTGPFAPASGPFSLFGNFPASLQPLETAEIDVQFRPTALGGGTANEADVAIASNDPDSPTTMSFTGIGVTLNAAFVLDLSGSMNSSPSGQYGVSESESRLGHAKTGGYQLFEIYRELTGGQANFGLYGFPDPSSEAAWSSATATPLVSMRSGNAALGPVGVDLDEAPPGGGGAIADGMTPMAEGIKVARADLDAGTHQRPLILLLSDGDHNLDSAAPNEEPEDWLPELQSEGIRMFTIGYGLEHASEVNFDLLEELANATGGAPLPANATEFDVLRKSFRSALKEWLGLREPVDPNSTIGPNQLKTHDVCIDKSDYTATFVVDWERAQDDAISLTLVSPSGETITPNSPDVAFFSSDTYALYVIKGARIRGGAGAGSWQMRLQGASNLPSGTKYSYSVLAGTPYPPQPTFRADRLLTGEVLEFAVSLSHLPEARYRDLELIAHYDAPANSYRTFVAEAMVAPDTIFGAMSRPVGSIRGTDELRRRPDDRPDDPIREPASSIFQAKVQAIQASDLRFSNQRETGEIRLYDDGTHGDRVARDGVFSNDALPLVRDGLHGFEVVIDDLTPRPRECLGGSFRFGKYVDIGLSADLLAENLFLEEVDDDLFFDPRVAGSLEPVSAGFARRVVVVKPQDQHGNLWGPGRADDVSFALQDAKAASRVIDNADGEYLMVIDFEEGAEPQVAATVGDTSSPMVTPEERDAKPWWALVGAILLGVLIVILAL